MKVLKAPHKVLLWQIDDGTILVQAGCKELAFKLNDVEHLLGLLRDYFTSPLFTIEKVSELYGWPLEAQQPEQQTTQEALVREALSTSLYGARESIR